MKHIQQHRHLIEHVYVPRGYTKVGCEPPSRLKSPKGSDAAAPVSTMFASRSAIETLGRMNPGRRSCWSPRLVRPVRKLSR